MTRVRAGRRTWSRRRSIRSTSTTRATTASEAGRRLLIAPCGRQGTAPVERRVRPAPAVEGRPSLRPPDPGRGPYETPVAERGLPALCAAIAAHAPQLLADFEANWRARIADTCDIAGRRLRPIRQGQGPPGRGLPDPPANVFARTWRVSAEFTGRPGPRTGPSWPPNTTTF